MGKLLKLYKQNSKENLNEQSDQNTVKKTEGTKARRKKINEN